MSSADSPLLGLDVEPLRVSSSGQERASARARLKTEAPEFVPPWPFRSTVVILLVGVGAPVYGMLTRTGTAELVPGVPLQTLGFVVSRRVAWSRRLRLAVFAERNGFVFRPVDDSVYPGTLFQQGGARRLESMLRRQHDRVFEAGEFVFETGSEKNRRQHRRGYLMLQLDRRLPHILLDARSNNGLFGSNLSHGFDRSQILGLEGDFDRYFTLYCPRGYERDALYVFTPDVMAAFIDGAADVDVEIVDDLLFVYLGDGLRLDDPTEWGRIERIVSALWPKTAKQTSAYSDDRAMRRSSDGGYPTTTGASATEATTASAAGLLFPPSVTEVAEAGRRLRGRIPVVTTVASVVLTLVAVGFWIFRLAA